MKTSFLKVVFALTDFQEIIKKQAERSRARSVKNRKGLKVSELKGLLHFLNQKRGYKNDTYGSTHSVFLR
jgi:hypothetical protein